VCIEMSSIIHTVLVRYEEDGKRKFEFVFGSKSEIEERLLEYTSSKDPHSLKIYGGLTDE